MGSISTFKNFANLPPEVRDAIWEAYYQIKLVHIVHPDPNRPPRHKKDPNFLKTTSVDIATKKTITGKEPTLLINHEAADVARRLNLTGPDGPTERINFSRVLADPRLMGNQFSRELHYSKTQRKAWRKATVPARINWARDLLCVAPMTNFQDSDEMLFYSLTRLQPYPKLKRLAILAPSVPNPNNKRSLFLSFRGDQFYHKVLTNLASLEEIYIVYQPPQAIPAQLERDEFGFVEWVDYVRAVGVDSTGTDFVRLGMHLDDAVELVERNAARGIQLHKVASADWSIPMTGEYRKLESS
ncbi:hypothetical protein DL766_007192 [Monosporascus sp. MC13-8B]|uniref:2EXR domain-containing protein n=1 Tax=Monosporascus cannonballus TaxID=155416 RepID=A0ABY0GZK2_9PEZI|nr:hypothetical protein DL762_007298 [Monosporascus cannonballus]RYO94539.1 hypothetical protein DL763_004046 [Monosporascus cannonballus]RYP24925.1 hypothetical protein DL766_007192 [Monosporascus sp. MC13-8B]